jgi:hypothetical protein
VTKSRVIELMVFLLSIASLQASMVTVYVSGHICDGGRIGPFLTGHPFGLQFAYDAETPSAGGPDPYATAIKSLTYNYDNGLYTGSASDLGVSVYNDFLGRDMFCIYFGPESTVAFPDVDGMSFVPPTVPFLQLTDMTASAFHSSDLSDVMAGLSSPEFCNDSFDLVEMRFTLNGVIYRPGWGQVDSVIAVPEPGPRGVLGLGFVLAGLRWLLPSYRKGVSP